MELSATPVRTVYASNLGVIATAIEKLARRAKRLSLPVPVLHQGKPYVREEITETGAKKRSVVADVWVENAIVKLPGWNLVAALDHAENLVRVVPGKDLPQRYRGAAQTCDHCKVVRDRKISYVVELQSETGVGHHQVGSGCVADFLGHDGARAIELGTYALAIDELLDSTGGKDIAVDLRELLIAAGRSISVNGWLSKAAAAAAATGIPSTADMAEKILFATGKDLDEIEKFFPLLPEHFEKADEAIEWALAITPEQLAAANSDYLYNCQQVAKNGFATRRSLGVAVSILGAVIREKSKMAEKAMAPESNWFGELGQKGVFTLTLVREQSIIGDWGTSMLRTFVDPDGNVAKWFSTSAFDAQIGQTFQIQATVKRHETYQGKKSTLLLRAKVYVPKPAKVKKARKVKAAEIV